MDLLSRLQALSINMPYESAEGEHSDCNHPATPDNLPAWSLRLPITNAQLSNGKTIPLLKTMQTSVCENNCNYCCFRSGRDVPRVNLTPDELASAVVKLSNVGIAKGVFLSSGVAGGGIRTQDKIIATAEILRKKYQYPHYVHLKIMPGAEKDQIYQAMLLADRVSINLEAPNQTCLRKLSPHKHFYEDLIKPFRDINEIRKTKPPINTWKKSWPSSCTQFVVGAAGETDLALLQTTIHLQSQFNIARAYFSRFTPVPNTPFESMPPETPSRQHRLYQAFFLLRDYNFGIDEILFNKSGRLNLEKDPKLSWAEANLTNNPVEINTANYHQLIKIPGIGPKSAQKILITRANSKIVDIHSLRKMGVSTARASRFILLNGRQPPYQPELIKWENSTQR